MKNFDRNKNWYDYGSSSQSIIELFECDKCLRFKFLEYTEEIESEFSTKLVDFISEKLINVDGVIFSNNSFFNTIFSPKTNKEYIFNLLTKYIEPSDKLFLKYIEDLKINYNKIPIWILSQSWTFGDLINLFKLLNKDLQYKIIDSYKNLKVSPDQFINIMKIIKKIRNISAHKSVLYNIEINFKKEVWNPIFKNKVFDIKIENNFFNLFNLTKIIGKFTNNKSRNIIYDLELILKNKILTSKLIPKNSKFYILDKIGIKMSEIMILYNSETYLRS